MKNKHLALLALLIALPFFSHAQLDYRFDLTVYKTLYPADLCQFLKDNPTTRLIDVRSPGEYADTSASAWLNIGHLKNAVNISIDSIEKKLDILKKNTTDPIVLYCSHSQRSRRVSRFLMENGFTKVWNLNGGMTYMNQAGDADFPCKNDMIVSQLPYKTSAAAETIGLINNTKDLLIIDVRKHSEFEGKDSLEYQNIGRIKNAVNIPAAGIPNNLSKLDKDKTILLYDSDGTESNKVASLLYGKGYKHVHQLLGGIEALIMNIPAAQKNKVIVNSPTYKLLSTTETIDLLQQKPDAVVLDIRDEKEFNNKSASTWKNLGHVKNAINIPPPAFDEQVNSLLKYKDATVVVYGTPEAALACKKLKALGFKDVNLVYAGIWDLISSSFNIKGLARVREVLVDHQNLY